MIGFDKSQSPWVPGDKFAAGMWLVRFDATGAEQDVHAFPTQLLDAAVEWGAPSKSGVYEWEDDDRDAEGGGLGEDA